MKISEEILDIKFIMMVLVDRNLTGSRMKLVRISRIRSKQSL